MHDLDSKYKDTLDYLGLRKEDVHEFGQNEHHDFESNLMENAAETKN